MRGLSMAFDATVPSGEAPEGAAARIGSTKGKQDLKTTAKTV
jgi:hypothetical protein